MNSSINNNIQESNNYTTNTNMNTDTNVKKGGGLILNIKTLFILLLIFVYFINKN